MGGELTGIKVPTWPAPAVVVAAVLVLDVVALVLGLLEDAVVAVGLKVRVNDRHHLTAFTGHIVDHCLRVGELAAVPREVSVEKW